MRTCRTFLLDRLKDIFGLNRVGLYRDDGLAVLPNSSSFKVEKLKKKRTHAFFKPMGFKVTVESPLVITEFLDVKLNLNDISFMPYKRKMQKLCILTSNSVILKTP